MGGLGEGRIGVGVAIDVFLGVEPEWGLAAPGVAMVLKTARVQPVTHRSFSFMGKARYLTMLIVPLSLQTGFPMCFLWH